MTDRNNDAWLLRLAVQNLAAAPQAQRRYIQLGFMSKTVDNLNRIAADLDPLIEAELITDEQAALAREVRDELNARLADDPDFLRESVAAPREFLFSTELETDAWQHLRLTARRAYSAIAGESSVFVSMMAK